MVESGQSTERRRLIISDDDPNIIDLIKSYVKDLHDRFEVLIFGSADEAEKEIKNNYGGFKDGDIILTDINMPGTNGIKYAEKLREAFGERIKIIIMSATFNEHQHELDRINNVADLVLAKPMEKDKLLGALETIERMAA